jgi:hypothetical protein
VVLNEEYFKRSNTFKLPSLFLLDLKRTLDFLKIHSYVSETLTFYKVEITNCYNNKYFIISFLFNLPKYK